MFFIAAEPEVFLKGKDRVVCGDTARFDADVKNVEFSCWRFTWQKLKGNSMLGCIDTNQKKYKGSINKILLIQNVSKEDEGEYQAVISREANGIEYRISSNIVYLHAIGGTRIKYTHILSNLQGRKNNHTYYLVSNFIIFIQSCLF